MLSVADVITSALLQVTAECRIRLRRWWFPNPAPWLDCRSDRLGLWDKEL